MIPTEVFDRFARGDYVPLMAQAAMEHALSPRVVDQLVEESAERQYTRDLLFSSVVGLLSLVICRIRPAVHAVYPKGAVPMTVTLPALYGKIRRIDPTVGAALVRRTAERLAAVIQAMPGGAAAPLPGYRTKILDGNHLPGSEHRINELRTPRAGALPGRTLVVLDPEAMLVIDAFPSSCQRSRETGSPALLMIQERRWVISPPV